MKKILRILSATLIVIGLAACDGTKQTLNGGDQEADGPALQGKMPKGHLKAGSYVLGEILIKFKVGVGPEKAGEIVQSLGYEIKVKEPPIQGTWDRWLTVLLPDGTVVREAMRKAASHRGVEYVQPNWIYRITPLAGK